MEQYIFLVGKIFVTTIIFVSLFGHSGEALLTLNDGNEKYKRNSWWIESLHLPYIVAFLYVLCQYPLTILGLFFLSCQIVITSLNLVLSSRKVIKKCNCYGSLNLGGVMPQWSISAILLLGCISLAYQSAKAISSGVYWPKLGLAEVLVFMTYGLAAVLSIYTKHRDISIKKQKTSLPPEVLTPSLISVSKTDVIAEKVEGGDLTYGELTEKGLPIIILGASTDCEVCIQSKSRFTKLASLLKNKIQTVYLYLEDNYDISEVEAVHVAGGSTGFIEKYNIQGFPYALLLDSQTLKPLAPVVYGVHKIWLLYFMTLGILEEAEKNQQTA
ncbi:hypothetical protein LPN04_04095 [Rugamonas sp. A1-17]|nr:hypothetical protein [Rugamonas sp. A1-17]